MLQCVAVCCSMLQCVAVCCSVLQCVDRWISDLKSSFIHIDFPSNEVWERECVCVCERVCVWERESVCVCMCLRLCIAVAVCFSRLGPNPGLVLMIFSHIKWVHVYVCVCVFMYTATITHCNTLQHTATHCNTLQQIVCVLMCVCIRHDHTQIRMARWRRIFQWRA